ncbi:MAG: hypothetical protein KBG15_06005 [Kofleriaceae bacterium]|nr:hypothetical protein [Kofleriaceae bacterium]
MDPIELRAWIVASQRTQKRVVAAAFAGLVVGYGLRLGHVFPTLVTSVIMLFAVILGICGFWVTAAHISDWRMRLDRHARSQRRM